VRSLHHDNGDHFAAAHWMLTGRLGATAVSLPQRDPSVGSYVARVRGPNRPGLPAYVGLPSAQSVYLFPGYQGAAYLGPAYNPFDVDRVTKYIAANSTYRVGTPAWLSQFNKAMAAKTSSRRDLLKAFDTIRRDLDTSGTVAAMDKYQQQAMEMILGG